jgi:hypothetical protein
LYTFRGSRFKGSRFTENLGLAKKVRFTHDFGLKGQIQDAAGSSKGFKDSRYRVSEG